MHVICLVFLFGLVICCTTITEGQECTQGFARDLKLELVLVADNTAITFGSKQGSAGWSTITSFLSHIVYAFFIDQSAVRVSLITYTSSASVNFYLSSYNDKNSVMKAIISAPYSDTTTANFSEALDAVANQVLHSSAVRPDTYRVVVIVMIRLSGITSDISRALDTIKNAGTKIIVVGYSGLSSSDLESLSYDSTGTPTPFRTSFFSDLDTLSIPLSQVLNYICQITTNSTNKFIATSAPPEPPRSAVTSGVKTACVSRCSTCSSATTCLTCDYGYYLNASSLCAACVSPCSTCSSATTCSTCDSGYYLNTSSACAACVSPCSTCSSATTCSTCDSGYYLNTSSACAACVSRCSTCSSATTCLTCDSGYYLNASSLCAACVSPCSTCSSATTCSTCDSGYYLNTSSACAEPTFPTLTIDVIGDLYGPLDGGTRFTLIGDSLILASSNFSSSSAYTSVSTVNIGVYKAVVVDSALGKLVVNTPMSSETGRRKITLGMSNGGLFDTNRSFEYRNNTWINDIQPRQHLFVGGTVVDVTGIDVDSVAQPGISATVVVSRLNDSYSSSNTTRGTYTTNYESCSVVDSNGMQCRMPIVNIPPDMRNATKNSDVYGVAAFIGPNGSDRADVYIGLILDGQETYRNISKLLPNIKFRFSEAPDLNCTASFTFNPTTDTFLAIKGTQLTRGNRQVDVKVNIGDSVCSVTQLTDNEIVCRPPVDTPGRGNSTLCQNGGSLPVQVFIGYAEYHCNCIQYTSSSNIPLIVGLVVGLGGGIIVVIVVVIVIVVCMRRRRNKCKLAAYSTALATGTYDTEDTNGSYTQSLPNTECMSYTTI